MFEKTAKVMGLKALGAGKPPTDEQMAQINKFALTQLTPEQVHVRRYLMCHNGVDRDVERFSEGLLDDFAKTLIGKGFFVEGHPSFGWSGKTGPGEGRFFNAVTEEMTPERFQELTGEDIKLPEGISAAKVLWGDAYIPRLESNADTLAKIDAGVYAFISIGFKASCSEVTDEHGNEIYGEYQPNGEAREGSLVWLGAQPGASVMKNEKRTTQSNQGGQSKMKEFLKKLSERLGKTLSEDGAVDEIAAVIAEKDVRIKELEPLAKDGEAYRKDLIDDALRFGQMIGEIPDAPEAQKQEGKFIATWPIERIKGLREKYEARARQKFPEKFTFQGKDEADRQQQARETAQKTPKAGRKDYSDPTNNELFATVAK